MLGPPKPRRLNDPIAVSLEELVPPSNFYRHLEAKLDLSFGIRRKSATPSADVPLLIRSSSSRSNW
jgi:hypothetical protein